MAVLQSGVPLSSPSPTDWVVVDIEGDVDQPGLVRLPLGSRVADAISAAGGLRTKGELGQINLAERLDDGQLIVVGAVALDGGVWLRHTVEGLKSGAAKVLFTLERDAVPGVEAPTIYAFVKTDEQRQILDLVYSQTTFGRPFMMAAEVPRERVEALRTAFDATMRDPAFLEEAGKIKLDIRPLPGAEVQALITKVFSTPPEVVEKAKRAMTQR